MKPSGHSAVSAMRHEPPDSLDYFPTPPWASRALVECVLKPMGLGELGVVWEPACGEGHMAEALRPHARLTWASDIHDYGYGDVLDFTDAEAAQVHNTGCDWIVTNPPFNKAIDFAKIGQTLSNVGCALLCRIAWIEGERRYRELFSVTPPAIVAPFVERVPMVKGRWDPKATTATSYAWFVWIHRWDGNGTRVAWIPPGQRKRLTKPDDSARFGARIPAPLLDTGEARDAEA